MGIFTDCLPVVKIILIIKKILPEPNLPKRRGRPFVYSLPIMMCCFTIMVAKGLSVRSLWEYLKRNDPDANLIRESINFPDNTIPNRRTFDRRFANWDKSAKLYIQEAASWFITRKIVGVSFIALDRKMFKALGSVWHSKDKKAGKIPKGVRNIDEDASWKKSGYRGWVYGHALDVFVTVGRIVIPILSSVSPLQKHENVAAKEIVDLLPNVKKGILVADSAYIDPVLQEKAQDTGRALKTASRKGKVPDSKIYQKRKVTVEPFFERLLLAFPHLRYKLPVKGKDRVSAYLTTVIFVYLSVAILNVLTNKHPLEITHFLQFL